MILNSCQLQGNDNETLLKAEKNEHVMVQVFMKHMWM